MVRDPSRSSARLITQLQKTLIPSQRGWNSFSREQFHLGQIASCPWGWHGYCHSQRMQGIGTIQNSIADVSMHKGHQVVIDSCVL